MAKFIKKSSDLTIIKKQLTFTPKKLFGDIIPEPVSAFMETKDNVVVPPFFEHPKAVVITGGIEIPFKTPFKHTFELHSFQNDIIRDYFVKSNNAVHSKIICIPTGKGKTVCSLDIMSKVGLKTLIICNRTNLLKQWEEIINKQKHTLKVQVYSSSKGKEIAKNLVDIDIFLINVQSLINDTFNITNLKPFGLCIIDECHNVNTKVFSKALWKISSKYRVGLSATPERKDNMEAIMKLFLGPIISLNNGQTTKQNTLVEIIQVPAFRTNFRAKLYNGDLNISRTLSNIAECDQRTQFILDKIKTLLNNKHRKLLVLADRKTLLEQLFYYLGDVSGLFIGGMKEQQLELSKEKRVVLATYSISAEGFNLPELNTLILATPRSSITQSLGRIFRKHHHAVQPLIVDYVDDYIDLFKNQSFARKRVYRKELKDLTFVVGDGVELEELEDPGEISTKLGKLYLSV
jgi:superfamily II DNA or RNA helicase